MRVYHTLRNAALEIKRDLSKAPSVFSTRVQHHQTDLEGKEILGYGYEVQAGGIPSGITDLLDLADEVLTHYRNIAPADRAAIAHWLKLQAAERTINHESFQGIRRPSDKEHPWLKKTLEGNHFSYTYRERMQGIVPWIVQTLYQDKDTRRAYWPIFLPNDTMRAPELTRIPCSLGYHFVIRYVPGRGDQLHMTYLQRSCDFDRFWITDVYLAHRLQTAVHAGLSGVIPGPVDLGNFSHYILSLHSFDVVGREIY